MTDPTRTTYQGLTEAYDFFNERLFGGRLPRCLITYQRQRGAYGYFAGKRFGTKDGEEVTDEIALNPAHFRSRTTEQVGGARRDPQTIALVRALDSAAYQHNAAGNLLNQLLRHAHTTGELGEQRVAELDELIALFRKAADMHVAALDHALEQSARGRAADAA